MDKKLLISKKEKEEIAKALLNLFLITAIKGTDCVNIGLNLYGRAVKAHVEFEIEE